ncbi:hypothetical protein F5Y15DRAFT_413913 [Xylariaceae sp. FL0016]|nr:hypothetical protein F5Y15DRAFT_413913 [Xylariaceae sp. FL0016]
MHPAPRIGALVVVVLPLFARTTTAIPHTFSDSRTVIPITGADTVAHTPTTTDGAFTTIWSDGTPHPFTSDTAGGWSINSPDCGLQDCITSFGDCRGHSTTWVE